MQLRKRLLQQRHPRLILAPPTREIEYAAPLPPDCLVLLAVTMVQSLLFAVERLPSRSVNEQLVVNNHVAPVTVDAEDEAVDAYLLVALQVYKLDWSDGCDT